MKQYYHLQITNYREGIADRPEKKVKLNNQTSLSELSNGVAINIPISVSKKEMVSAIRNAETADMLKTLELQNNQRKKWKRSKKSSSKNE